MRKFGESGSFLSQIPEDIRQKLNIYLEYAHLRREDISKSFQKNVWKLEEKLYISYTNAYLRLAEEYWKAIYSQNWLERKSFVEVTMNEAEENYIEYLTERMEWLCSIANDTRRVTEGTLMLDNPGIRLDKTQQNHSHSYLESKTNEQGNTAFDSTFAKMLDQTYAGCNSLYILLLLLF
jgi:hypothetical protein